MSAHEIASEVQKAMSGYTISVAKRVVLGSTANYYIMRDVNGRVRRLSKQIDYIDLLAAWKQFRGRSLLTSNPRSPNTGYHLRVIAAAEPRSAKVADVSPRTTAGETMASHTKLREFSAR